MTKYHAHILLLTVLGSKLFDHPSYIDHDLLSDSIMTDEAYERSLDNYFAGENI